MEIDEDTIPMPSTPQVASEPASEVQIPLPCTSDGDDDVIDTTRPIETINLDEYDDDQGNEEGDNIVKEENKENESSETTTPNLQPKSEFATSRSSFHSSAGSSILTPPSTPSPDICGAYKNVEYNIMK